MGSSPRVRGTRQTSLTIALLIRFIPAGAGNTALVIFLPHYLKVHPRGCGEHAQDSSLYFKSYGSSPRVRGTHRSNRHKIWLLRFIPAGAGNTSQPRPAETLTAVHPRGCGEHLIWNYNDNTWFGSSPRVRGTLSVQATQPNPLRFIPAGAGNTVALKPTPRPITVHPRGCGEHSGYRSWVPWIVGSSTRVRGTRRENKNSTKKERFIPAGAGNT